MTHFWGLLLDIGTIRILLQLGRFITLNLIFSFKNVTKEEILKELNNLKIKKATQSTDIPTKTIMENFDIFGDLIFSNLNGCVNTSLYPLLLKMANITLVYKKDSKVQKVITDQLVYCQTSPKCMNGSCLNKRQNTLKVFSINTNVDLEKDLELSIV